ncbi:hypothetical protein QP905_00145 [Corynebacterium pseudodiphtheriticum]|uniref:hypothetical protein n=1 Tax=Corynebacterium pseudodiphtheriticum TaxID=37637 RepID=UPI00254B6344|nr:hypothetical protein [Corynebacterium pseudodiphtheriticum]MDK8576773.1 hypothetical protein [Corynebacterium pseudodiphtheriticum]
MKDESLNTCPKTWQLKTPGYAEKNPKLRDTNELLQTTSAFSHQNQDHNPRL